MTVYLSMVCQWCEDPFILGVYSTQEAAQARGDSYIKTHDEFEEMYVNVREFIIDKE